MESHQIFLSDASLGQTFLAISSLLIFAHLFGILFSKLNFPRVVGEIFGGILLGPSCLGSLSPTLYQTIFHSFPEQGKVLAFFYWTGLVLLMFTAGFKVSRSLEREDQKTIVNLIISSTVFPVIGGLIYCYIYDFRPYQGSLGSDLSMKIIVCIAIAVTSIPVISKIFLDLDIMQSRFARVVLAASTLQDLILWVALGVAVKSTVDPQANIYLIALISFLFLTLLFLLRPYLGRLISRTSGNLLLEASPIGYILGICFLMAVLANYLGINIAFGALMAGVIVSTLPGKKFHSVRTSISDFSRAFFIPIYFAIVGLKINLPAHFDLGLFMSFLTISSFLEITSVYLGLKILGLNRLTRLNFGLAMNTRGGPGIMIASIAFEAGIINETFFVVLILSAIITSLISGSWFRFVLSRGWPLFQYMNKKEEV